MILSLLCKKGVTVEFLIDCLRLLPCLCALKVLQKHLSEFVFKIILLIKYIFSFNVRDIANGSKFLAILLDLLHIS